VKSKVLFVIGSMEVGGAEKQLLLLATKLLDCHFSCAIFALQKNGPLKKSFLQRKITVYDGGLAKGDLRRAPWKLTGSIVKLIRIIKKEKPEVIHAFLPVATFVGALCGRLTGVPLIITGRRALGCHQNRYPLLKIVDRTANRLSHYVTVNSQAVRDDTILRDHIEPSKLVVIYNGIDSQAFETTREEKAAVRQALGISLDERVMVTVANLIPYKGHAELLFAICQVLPRFPTLKVLFIGEDRGIQGHLVQMATHYKLSDHVRFLGRRDDIVKLMAVAELSVLPSHEEGFSNVILESMAAGLPVVATDVGGSREAVTSGVTGWLVPPKNPAKLAEKIIDLLSEPEKARRWGQKGRAAALNCFHADKMVENYIKLYSEKLCAVSSDF
jgi:glycosyltransferase involved in cell wall biosynthesis